MSKCRRIAFACNDYRNGHFAGRFEAVHFDLCGEMVELDGPSIAMSFTKKYDRMTGMTQYVRIGGNLFQHFGIAEWVGNWCWDEIWLRDCSRLLRILKARGFRCNCAPTRFFEAFNNNKAALDAARRTG